MNKQRLKRAKNTPQNILPEGVSAFNSIYNQYKSGSKRRGYSFNLTKEEFKILIDRGCSYCGAPPSRERKTGGGSYFYNGIDRLDNSIGYEKGNCITICTKCNFFKGTMNSEEFLELINIISKKNIVDNGVNENKLDSYYKRALAVASDSPDEQTKVGSILINKKSGAVIASGYNGFVRGADDSNLPKTRPEKYNYIVHSEENLIYNCARHGISTRDCAVFVTLSPCQKCTRSLYQSGITTIYFKDKYRDFKKQISLGDLLVDIKKIGPYTKMDLRPNKVYQIENT